ncbi:MAG: dialkylresorcinol condensing enzyme DarA [Chlorobi bacterium]|nr:dialkylresorcinol condensing enzyme DarA [Chlorobiota bacterium]
MKKILVIYYTQSGQIKDIINSVLKDAKTDKNVQIDYYKIEPEEDYPFPWRPSSKFYDVFPESVKSIDCKLKALIVNNSYEYDLVILGLQVWYLSPSIPISSFLKSDEAKNILKGKPVITVYGTRNMWVSANKTVKNLIKNTGGHIIGNIVFSDKHHNLISVITIVRWLINRKKEASKYFPEAGVSTNDIVSASKFGNPILYSLTNKNFDNLQNELLKLNAVQIDYHIMKTELTGIRIFHIWASIILKNSQPNSKKRKRLLKLFSYYLFFVIYAVSPVASLIFRSKKLIFPKKAKKETEKLTSL